HKSNKESKKAKRRKQKQSDSASSREDASEDGDDRCDSDEEPRDKKGKAAGKAKARDKKPRKKGGRRTGKNPKGKSQFLKCTQCKKTKDRSLDFHADQNRCKACMADVRAFSRATESQGCQDKIQELSRSDPATHAKVGVVKEWIRERKKMQEAGEKIKFNIWGFAIKIQHAQGQRVENRNRMMWKGYFLTWAQTDEGGCLSEQQAKNKWAEYEQDESLPKDNKGPGGHQRIKVPMFTDIVDFTELQKQRELKKTEKLNSKAMQDNKSSTAGVRLKMLVGGAGAESDLDCMGAAQQAWKSVHEKLTSNQLDGERALEPDAADLALDLQHQKARRASGASSGRRPDPSESSYGSEESSSDDGEGGAGAEAAC
ncbi:unnamed protein product, partial [Symbiodinium necroappetens]